MSEQLDNELRKRINEVFDNYEDTAPANEGWLLLREKYPEKKKRSLLPLWWSAAAVLLLLSLIGVWLYTQPAKDDILNAKSINKSSIPSNQPLKLPIDSSINNRIQSNKSELEVTKEEYAIQHSSKRLRSPLVFKNQLHDSSSYQITNDVAPHTTNTLAIAKAPITNVQSKPALNAADSVKQAKNKVIIEQPVLAKEPVKDQQQIIATAKANNKTLIEQSITTKEPIKGQQQTIATAKVDSPQISGASKMNVYLANEQKKKETKMQKAEPKAMAADKVLYSIYAATYFNYAEGSKSQMNTGAGVSTDIKLAGNFKLSTGIAIGKNTLNYNSQPQQASIARDAVRAASVSNAGISYDAVPNSSSSQFGFSSMRVLASPVVSAYNISLTGLDVPVNLKYEFNPQKSDSYISAGLSSGTFISETYNYSYDNSRNALGASPSIPDASVSRSFTRFDFARMLNFSLGMGYQITKGNRLIIEPFLKYPLSGMGSQDIRFGSGGVNLRLKFQGSNKKQ